MISTTVRAPRRDAADNRAAILAAAKVVFSRTPNASLEAIATHAGLSRRSVYGHFASRDDLLRELVVAGARRVADATADIDHPDPVVRLALIAGRLWREVEDIRVMAVFAVRGPLSVHTASALDPLRAAVLEAIRQGIRAGTVRDDVDPERLARLVENGAIAVLEESARYPLDAATGHRLAILTTLATVGLGWREADAFLAQHPELDRDGAN